MLNNNYDDGNNTIVYVNGKEKKRVAINYSEVAMIVETHKIIKQLGYLNSDVVYKHYNVSFAHFELSDHTIIDFKRF